MSRARPLWKRLVYPAAGLALAPTALAALAGAGQALAGLAERSPSARWFLGPFAAYCALHASGLLRLRPAYVFAHEASHALAAWASGERVHRFVVRADRGHVDLSRINTFIALAPYWLPLYALAAVGVYRAVLWAWSPGGAQQPFLAAMGVALAFHVCHTIDTLRTRQSDLDHAGLALSMSAIVLLNALVLLGAAKCLFPRAVRLETHVREVGLRTRFFWSWTASRAASLLEEARR